MVTTIKGLVSGLNAGRIVLEGAILDGTSHRKPFEAPDGNVYKYERKWDRVPCTGKFRRSKQSGALLVSVLDTKAVRRNGQPIRTKGGTPRIKPVAIDGYGEFTGTITGKGFQFAFENGILTGNHI